MSGLTLPASTFARRSQPMQDISTRPRPTFALSVNVDTEDDESLAPSRSAVAQCLHPIASRLMGFLRLQTTAKERPPVKHVYPNGATFVSFPASPLSQLYPVASANVTRYLRTRKYSTVCFVFFLSLEVAGLGLIWAYGNWNPLWNVVGLLWAVSFLANVLYIRVRGGVAGWHLLRGADPGFISVGGTEIDVSLLRRMLPDGPPPDYEAAARKEDDEDDSGTVDVRATERRLSPTLVAQGSAASSRRAPLHWPFCDVCCRVRPLRSKHCHDCGRCVGRFDHHCHWIGVCVGGRNRRAFFGLLVSMVVAISLGLVHLVSTFSAVPERDCAAACHLAFIVTTALGAMLLFVLLLGLAIQCSVVAANSSTYELLYSNSGRLRLVHPETGREGIVARTFDFGGYRNLVEFFASPKQDPINVGHELLTGSAPSDENRALL